MPRANDNIRVTPSVLDRLIDYEPRESREPVKSHSLSIMELKQSVLRDLEWLLNTRHGFEVPESLEESTRSVVAYGLPDFTGISVQSQAELNGVARDIENAVRFFEPRFLELNILFEPFSALDRRIRFRIDARLDVEPTPEPITFDTVLSSGSGKFTVLQK
jgi:type VI secretion system protein ImpF